MSNLEILEIRGKVKGFKIPGDFTIDIIDGGNFNFLINSIHGQLVKDLTHEKQQKLVLSAVLKATKVRDSKKVTFFEIYERKLSYYDVKEYEEGICLCLFNDKNERDFILRNIDDDVVEYLEHLIDDDKTSLDDKEEAKLLRLDVEYEYDSTELDRLLEEQQKLFSDFVLKREVVTFEVLDIGIFRTIEDAKKRVLSLNLKHWEIKERKF